ncbi:hypothetical protein BB934_37830 (plasmid) [Microvirga ossetica]|uniref:VWFA domain-containing protein n=1 Tax=Microvirga ossetica TaxID=1882682 RepID=A0A1B2EVM6_9HYPH|nr:DUF1194 domain-containing protein [Microvirga ossetica]ANY84027.1 hypothetical protein BB934_37830 [Microvirga ossetica]
MARSGAGGYLSLVAAALLLGLHGFAHAQPEVDLALVLAVDASSSMDADEADLQRQGYAEAFRSAIVQNAIRSGTNGRIAVIYMDWSDAFDQRIVVPWTLIAEAEQAAAFAKRLEEVPTRRAPGATSVSGALDFGRHLLMTAPFKPARKVIDISGDGTNNHGRPVAQARGATVLQGITINGLPLVFKRPDGPMGLWNVERYYRDCVIGGTGAFIIPVYDASHFAEAIRFKLVREIAIPSPDSLFKLAKGEPLMDCREGASNRSMR